MPKAYNFHWGLDIWGPAGPQAKTVFFFSVDNNIENKIKVYISLSMYIFYISLFLKYAYSRGM